MLLPKALTCMKYFLYKQNGYFFMETDTFGYIVVKAIYTSHTDHFTPEQTAFEHFNKHAYLSFFSYFLVLFCLQYCDTLGEL